MKQTEKKEKYSTHHPSHKHFITWIRSLSHTHKPALSSNCPGQDATKLLLQTTFNRIRDCCCDLPLCTGSAQEPVASVMLLACAEPPARLLVRQRALTCNGVLRVPAPDGQGTRQFVLESTVAIRIRSFPAPWLPSPPRPQEDRTAQGAGGRRGAGPARAAPQSLREGGTWASFKFLGGLSPLATLAGSLTHRRSSHGRLGCDHTRLVRAVDGPTLAGRRWPAGDDRQHGNTSESRAIAPTTAIQLESRSHCPGSTQDRRAKATPRAARLRGGLTDTSAAPSSPAVTAVSTRRTGRAGPWPKTTPGAAPDRSVTRALVPCGCAPRVVQRTGRLCTQSDRWPMICGFEIKGGRAAVCRQSAGQRNDWGPAAAFRDGLWTLPALLVAAAIAAILHFGGPDLSNSKQGQRRVKDSVQQATTQLHKAQDEILGRSSTNQTFHIPSESARTTATKSIRNPTTQ